MRPRIKTKVDVQSVIDNIEYRVKVYSQCVRDVMHEHGVEYNIAKSILERELRTKIIFRA